jgi:fluoride exporter
MNLALIAVAGGLGAVARFMTDGFFAARDSGRIPFGTLTVNLVGSFLLGVLTGLSLSHGTAAWHLVLGTGFCGGFTTFSTASLEVVRIWADPNNDDRLLAIGYGSVTLLAALALAAVGIWLGAL